MSGLFGLTGENIQEAQQNVWSTAKIEHLMDLIETGGSTKGIKKPFYDGNPQWRQGNIVFDYTEFEISEIKRCARDITYFAENYCTVMTDDGLQRIKLRDYQIDMLKHFVANRFSV